MSGHVSEEALALYLSGDLPQNQSVAVAEHLGSCGECRTSLSEFNQAQALFAEAFGEPVWEDLAGLRRSIADRVRTPRSNQKQWIWYLAGIAAMVLLLLFGIRQSPKTAYKAPVNMARATKPRKPAPAPTEPRPTPQQRQHPPAEMVRVRHRPRAPGIRAVALITRADQPPVIRISTSDPKVIILWQSDEGTERK